ncbi:Mannose-6-phosphate isomerase, cupin superfamily [Gracilibacillus ureilyticus]|uniref:Mannose-6-phosphate isomerase, cupin superfamily n=1 Tax=Gracilibacillus ureilyticus TaxID=531814 RepID=A0A1H9P9L8_9BACI|nr:cupin domain-containing protein [Gracilibacillus ureilyticus]SER44529.1 Mannose-6-phosphate isomerase, cupin superfamily [Gracilibacillus ureilyticus]
MYGNPYGTLPLYGGGPGFTNPVSYQQFQPNPHNMTATDYGQQPFVINIHNKTKQNTTFRTALWSGSHLQLTVMCLNVGEDIGLEMHPDVDQFLRIEQGQGFVQMGKNRNELTFARYAGEDSAIIIPAGTWHNLTNTGNIPLKLYSIYAPPNHPFGTIHLTKADAVAAEYNEGSNYVNFYGQPTDFPSGIR